MKLIERTCVCCGKIFYVKFSSDRIKNCSIDCGRKTGAEKCSKKLKEYYKHNESKTKGEKHSRNIGRTTKGKFKPNATSLCELSKRTISKILKRMGIGCVICGWKEASCDIHHIWGRKIKEADQHKNLTILCPNHHRWVHENKITDLKNLEDLIGDNWKKYYYG